jgi:hypothetical protein
MKTYLINEKQMEKILKQLAEKELKQQEMAVVEEVMSEDEFLNQIKESLSEDDFFDAISSEIG